MRILLIIILFLSISFAHKLNIFLLEEDQNIIVSSYFASGSYCKNCDLKIYNLNKKLIIKDKTNEKGEYIFAKPKESFLVKVEATGGHGAFKEFEINSNITNTNEEIPQIKTLQEGLIQSLIAILLIYMIFLILQKTKKRKY